jgi:hypothetical protein
MDQVELEATEPYLARSARSVRFWRSVLEEVPLDLFDYPSGEPEDPPYIEVGMELAALTIAAQLLAQRWSSSTSGVLLAACATVLATVSGRAKCGAQQPPGPPHPVGLAGGDWVPPWP